MNLGLPTTLYVASNLLTYRDPNPASPAELIRDGRSFRRLDPATYAWLRRCMEKARQSHQDGRIASEAYATLRARFNAIHDEAIRLFGEAALLQAVRSFNPATYHAPTRCDEAQGRLPSERVVEGPRETDPANPGVSPTRKRNGDMQVPDYAYPEGFDLNLRFTQPVYACALEEVRRIETEALAAGWTLPRLYQNRGRYRFPYGGDYGIVCFIDPGQRLGEVTPQTIDLICRDGHRLRFRQDPTHSHTEERCHAGH